ncbi:cupredoxin domain-containing protein [Aromatoleum toluolicum]|uniref:Cupredoxin domain-containing protein n=1 Tax=Aromatoleum toluolicum TaxID=90060 RepID=A0ABX1NP68_9RHOO|nr:cupredoxin domain-containing protein [Aromatoleum toluolicum]NMG01097.1 cupredoxin domain-containing protein [Aromatoleum toluolicum]
MPPIPLTAFLAGLVVLAAPAAHADMPTFEIVAENGRLTPETIEVPANTRFRLQLTNRNAGPEEFETTSPFKELVVGPGVTRTTIFPPLKPGSYPFFGEFHPDTAKGRFVAK